MANLTINFLDLFDKLKLAIVSHFNFMNLLIPAKENDREVSRSASIASLFSEAGNSPIDCA